MSRMRLLVVQQWLPSSLELKFQLMNLVAQEHMLAIVAQAQLWFPMLRVPLRGSKNFWSFCPPMLTNSHPLQRPMTLMIGSRPKLAPSFQNSQREATTSVMSSHPLWTMVTTWRFVQDGLATSSLLLQTWRAIPSALWPTNRFHLLALLIFLHHKKLHALFHSVTHSIFQYSHWSTHQVFIRGKTWSGEA